MPIEEKDFYVMQAHMIFQDEKLEELKERMASVETKLDTVLAHMHQNNGSTRTIAFFSGLIGAILAGASEYFIYYVLQK